MRQRVPIFAVLHLIGLNGVIMRLRMQLYEIVLAEALTRRATRGI